MKQTSVSFSVAWDFVKASLFEAIWLFAYFFGNAIGNSTSLSMWLPILGFGLLLAVLLPFLKIRISVLLTVCSVFACVHAGFCDFTQNDLSFFTALWFWIVSFLIQWVAWGIGRLISAKIKGKVKPVPITDKQTLKKAWGLIALFAVYEVCAGVFPSPIGVILIIPVLLGASVILMPEGRVWIRLLPYQFALYIVLFSFVYYFPFSVAIVGLLIGAEHLTVVLLLFEADTVLIQLLALGIRRLISRHNAKSGLSASRSSG